MCSSVFPWTTLKEPPCSEGCSFGFDVGDGWPPLVDLILQMMLWYSRGLPMKSWRCWTNGFHLWMMQAWNWVWIKIFVGHNTSLATTVFQTSTGAVITAREKNSGDKWLGCMLPTAGSTTIIGFWLPFTNLYNLWGAPSLPTDWFFWAGMSPSETNWNFSMPSFVLELAGASIVPIKRPRDTELGGDLPTRWGWRGRGGCREMEDLLQGCGGTKDLQIFKQ